VTATGRTAPIAAQRKSGANSEKKPEEKVLKLTLSTAAVLLGLGASAYAAPATWQVTEEKDGAGIKIAQGDWLVTADGDKISGTANMQLQNGNPLTYKFDGTLKDGVYTLNITDRTDGKKGCVWTGHVPTGMGVQTKGLNGYEVCEGTKLILRATGM
jgi:predicted lipoprotein with Yx(FWY)xxD motif